MSMSAWLRTGSERSARQQQAFARPLPPDRVPDPVLLTVLSCPFYGVTPSWASSEYITAQQAEPARRSRRGNRLDHWRRACMLDDQCLMGAVARKHEAISEAGHKSIDTLNG